MSYSRAVLLALVLGAGCDKSGYVVVTVHSDEALTVTSFAVDVTAQGTTGHVDIVPPGGSVTLSADHTFAIELDESRTGDVTVLVQAMSDEIQLARGSGSATSVAGSTVPLTISLSTACTPGTDNALCQSRNPGTPICDASGTCRGCQAHSDCASGACLPDGRCAPEGEVAFVDNGGQAPATCKSIGAHDGSMLSPYCDIQDAVAAIPVKPYVVVAWSTAAYGAVTITDLNVTLLGPGAQAPYRPMITSFQGTPAVTLNGVNNAEVFLDGFEIAHTANGRAGVQCGGNGGATKLTVVRSFIHDNSGPGLSASYCDVILDANDISSNQGGGVRMTSCSYAITNNIIAFNSGNSAGGAGVNLDVSTGTFAFNTVARNVRKLASSVGGIDCGSGAFIINSIVWGNDPNSGSQFSGNCNLVNVVTGYDSASGAIRLDPTFVTSSDFRLMAGDAANLDCCVDKVISPATPDADHDVDFNFRPKGAGWDIGAHEVQ